MRYRKQRIALVGHDTEVHTERIITLELPESQIKDLTEIATLSTHSKAAMYANGWKSFMKEVEEKCKS